MSKQIWKPGNMLYPVPAVLVSVADSEGKVVGRLRRKGELLHEGKLKAAGLS